MSDEETNEDLDDVSGGPDTVAPIITDIEGGAGSPSGSDSEDNLSDIAGGPARDSGDSTGE